MTELPVGATATQQQPQSLSGLTMAMLGGLVCVLVAGFLALVLTDHDTSSYTLFVAGPLVTTVVGALVGQRVRRVEEVAKTVEAQTNGLLSKNLADIHQHLDDQTAELLEAPAAATPTAVGAPRSPALPAQAPAAGAESAGRTWLGLDPTTGPSSSSRPTLT